VALKKAYADIILNTAKEAANRVMESERKALRYHHDLCNSKDEALRLLLRLQQMIDAKVSLFSVFFNLLLFFNCIFLKFLFRELASS
jgi:hypothetical protein